MIRFSIAMGFNLSQVAQNIGMCDCVPRQRSAVFVNAAEEKEWD